MGGGGEAVRGLYDIATIQWADGDGRPGEAAGRGREVEYILYTV